MQVAAQVVGEEVSNETVCKSVEREVFARSAPTSNQRAALRRGLLYGQQLSSLSRIDLERWRTPRKLPDCLPVCLEAISNRCSKDSSCAHKGLLANRLHHSIQLLAL
jgi:hypothetical protein